MILEYWAKTFMEFSLNLGFVRQHHPQRDQESCDSGCRAATPGSRRRTMQNPPHGRLRGLESPGAGLVERPRRTSVGNAIEGLQLFEALRPDLVIVDGEMPG